MSDSSNYNEAEKAKDIKVLHGMGYAQELDRRMKVFGGNHFGISPTINLHGIQFQAVPPAPQPAAKVTAKETVKKTEKAAPKSTAAA